MRVLKVRFKNLNSLVGEWEIDLTHPAFISDGIFAIVGPTGAGKTTVLDAICLGLYGSTPRLNKITKSENEIMARQTGECFAEVTFETSAGRFRCHWSQRRARGKPSGDLQMPRHELVDADTNQVLEEKLREVVARVETITGMNFERFTQSMLLAQGRFAEFLQSDADKRAPILEQITGTEIYSQISIYIHERRSTERNTLDHMEEELAGVKLLDEDEEQQLNVYLTQSQPQANELIKQIEGHQLALTWLLTIANLEKDLADISQQQQSLLTRLESFKSEQERLDRANQALELSAEYAVISALRGEQDRERTAYHDSQQLYPQLETKLEIAKNELQTSQNNLEQKKSEQKICLPLYRKVRELDTLRQEKETPIKEIQNSIATLKKSKVSLLTAYQNDCQSFDAKKIELSNIENKLQDNKTDAALIEQLEEIKSRFDGFRNLYHAYKAKTVEQISAEKQKAEALTLWQQQSVLLAENHQKVCVLQAELTQQQSELDTRLSGRDLADWRNTLTQLNEKRAVLKELIQLVQSIAENKNQLDDLNTRHSMLLTEKMQLNDRINVQNEIVAALEQEILLLETTLSTLKRIQDFDHARHQLQDDQPCPLCGAIDHPFAAGNIPTPDETLASLNFARKNHKEANAILTQLKTQNASKIKDIEHSTVKKQELAQKLVTQDDQLKQGLDRLSLDSTNKNLNEFLINLLQEDEASIEKTSEVVQIADAYEKKIKKLREDWDQSRELLHQQQQTMQAATYSKDSAEQAVSRISKDLKISTETLQQMEEKVLSELAVFGFDRLFLDNLESIQLALISRRDQWVTWQKHQHELLQQLAKLEPAIQHQIQKINDLEREEANKAQILNNLVLEQNNITQERSILFGDKDPDKEEASLIAIIEEQEIQFSTSQQRFNSASQECIKLKSNIESLEQKLTNRLTQLQQHEEAFKARLQQFNFADESHYVAACLPEAERNHLMQQGRQLANEKTELATRGKDKQTSLEIEQQKRLTIEPYENLANELNNFKNNLSNLQQQIGCTQEKLRANDLLRQEQHEKARAIDFQKLEYNRWDRLHTLIGSSDGKKYRNFAQGLTFEMMIGHANRQLVKMTDRYLLLRDDTQPLELNVIDNYQAGEKRTTKNLSGGESFIVSLALALGLSQMASKNVRVDSLFLDEGFGTLDEDALDTALETLAGLQQSGKLIGVISHVPTLKDRISTQIQISSLSGGRSSISGPGCNQLDANN